jgi:UDP-glucose 6-dehydrogenase/dTDP-glucose pyrophosphorylase
MVGVSILGSGVVGTITGSGLEQLGNKVVFYDIRAERVRELLNSGLDATTDLDRAIRESDISFICVPTPTVDQRIDLSNITFITESIAKCLKEKHSYHLVVIKSTVIPTTTEKVIIPALEKNSGRKVGPDIGVCVNPEFLTEIHGSWADNEAYARNFFSEERVVIGEFDKHSGDTLQALYKPLEVPVIRTDLMTAEMIKYACNCALASRISYWNEIYYICQKLGIDSNLVAQVAGMDRRIGKYGTVHGKAFGGKCLPKDLEAFISFVEGLNYEPKLLRAIREINERIKADRGVREKAIVLAAGKGKRLEPLTLAIPKEMIRVGTIPVIEHVINLLKAGGVEDILVIVGRKKEAIMDYLGSGKRFGVQIYYRIQEKLKGTAHAVYLGKDFVGDEDFAVVYGDNYLKPYKTMKDVIKFHRDKNADATLVLHLVKDPRRFGVVKIDSAGRVINMIEKPTLREAKPYRIRGGYLNIAGVLILKPNVFEYIERTRPGKDDEVWITDSIKLMRKNGKSIYGFTFRGVRYDIGTFESLRKADELEQKERESKRSKSR